MKEQIFDIDPVAKPRMTQRDKWAKRPSVVKYWAFCKEVNILGITVEPGDEVLFKVPMPKSWSKKRKKEMLGMPHTQTPDIDNYLKALLDCIFDNDSHIWDIRAIKVWAYKGQIIITRG